MIFFRRIFLIILITAGVPEAFSINTCAEGYRVTVGGSTVINCNGICRQVQNNGASDQFVATKTATETNSFINNLPANMLATQWTVTLAANTNNVNVRTTVNGLGYGGVLATCVLVTINAGVSIGSANNATNALDTGTFPAGSIMLLTNNGNIIGKGGTGGQGGICNADSNASPGTAGGPALIVQVTSTITNNGTIGGGGGGGGGGLGGIGGTGGTWQGTGGTGGTAGAAVTGNGNITWTPTGTRYGAINN